MSSNYTTFSQVIAVTSRQLVRLTPLPLPLRTHMTRTVLGGRQTLLELDQVVCGELGEQLRDAGVFLLFSLTPEPAVSELLERYRQRLLAEGDRDGGDSEAVGWLGDRDGGDSEAVGWLGDRDGGDSEGSWVAWRQGWG